MDSKQFREQGKQIVDFIADYFENIRSQRVIPDVRPGFLQKHLPTEAPSKGEEFVNVKEDFEKFIMPGIVHWQSPNFHAYYPCGHSFPAVLGDLLSGGLGSIMFSWASNPAGTELEVVVMDWLGKMVKLPEDFLFEFTKDKPHVGGGCIQNTASESILVTMLAARRAALDRLRNRYPDDDDDVIMSRLIVYSSDQVHSCLDKAAMLAAVKLRKIPTNDEDQSMNVVALEKAVKVDEAMGLHPFYLCASLGTTSTCAFDDLKKIGPICQRESIWMHIDAAYSGPAFMCPEFRPLLDGVEFAESFNFNPHKLMLTNFDCSALWVKHRDMLKKAMHVDPIYLRKRSFMGESKDWEIPLGRSMRALKLWFVLRTYGLEGIQKHVRNHVKMAKLFESLLAQDSRFEQVAKVVLGLVCFKLKGTANKSKALLKAINNEGLIHMVPGELNGAYMIRFVVCSEWVKEEDIHFAWSVIKRNADKVLQGGEARTRHMGVA
ncbi:predicted protein [Nematostella vectensis]|uniref:Aromatic-L-amino-acid decarboxylase n=1 Tax=Nematostella vectensis TaxID=45351 RepID=A7RYV7_NEMVE|nr:predicted protein [Nematostella vectensis]|eukprot:XP_001635455.1 predicted protein [Nematostella vectensis]